ncbi:MAG: patatin-like phospholipase family protein [Bacteroidota bacterium]
MSRFFLSAFWPLVFCCASWAQPTIGLTLSGGGAKGLAHIGVLLELEKAGIYPHYISGTSMGSIVGGLYATGYEAEELAEFARGLDWNSYFSDGSERAYIPIEERQRSDRYQLSLPIIDGKLTVPRGLLRGRRIQTLLSTSTIDAHGIENFDSLCTPFRAVATNLENGQAYVFDRGPLRNALRASMSIPSLFAPVPGLNDELLVDGLVVRNLPVSDVRAMGADYVIAVNVGAPLLTRDELNSPLSIVSQTSSFINANGTELEISLANYLIEPELEPYNTLSYDETDSLIERGAKAAKQIIPDLIRQLDSMGIELPMKRNPCARLAQDSFLIDRVTVSANDPTTASILKRLLKLPEDEFVSLEQIEKQINLLYGTGFFDLIDFDLLPGSASGRELRINAEGNPPWRARFSLNYDIDYDIGFLANLTSRNLLVGGSLLALDLKISPNPSAQLEYLVYTRSNPRLGLRLLSSGALYPGRTFDAGEPTGEFTFIDYRLNVSGIFSLGNNRSLEAGLRLNRLSRNPRFFRPGEATEIRSEVALGARLIRDTYDRTFYPRQGSIFIIDLQTTANGRLISRLPETEERNRRLGTNWRALAHIDKVFPLGKDVSLIGRLKGGLLNGPGSTLVNSLYLGRQPTDDLAFTELYGYRYMELPADAYAIAGLDVRIELSDDFFATIGYEAGRFARHDERILSSDRFLSLVPERESGTMQGFGLELGTLTIAGPIQAGVQYRPDDGAVTYWLHGGYYF